MSVAGRPVKSDLQLVGLDLGSWDLCAGFTLFLTLQVFGFKRFYALKHWHCSCFSIGVSNIDLLQYKDSSTMCSSGLTRVLHNDRIWSFTRCAASSLFSWMSGNPGVIMRRGTLNKVPASSWGHRWLRRWWLEIRSNLDCQDFAKKRALECELQMQQWKWHECNKNIDSCLDRPGQCAFSIHWSHREFCNCSSSSRCFQPCDPTFLFLHHNRTKWEKTYSILVNIIQSKSGVLKRLLDYSWFFQVLTHSSAEHVHQELAGLVKFCWHVNSDLPFSHFRWMISQAIWLLSKPQSLKSSLVLKMCSRVFSKAGSLPVAYIALGWCLCLLVGMQNNGLPGHIQR